MAHNPKLIRRRFGRTALLAVTLAVAGILLAGVLMLLL
ncbi:hypothetical protein SAMN05421833_13561 [Microbispora rosea]|uniref:Uncharacterized protein n=1 Tax=Microbispora rosea TaxID=58117 RepID=A0A1N7H1C1_9ACTN|nr:hypothetical protein SAMN05421833_13561 [Microbispora rosea]